MNILILGGTEFVGRHLTERAIKLGHQVSLFHRGKHGADLFPEAEHILGDRDGGLDALGDRTWDAVIDTCGYVPRIVRESCEYLKDKTGRYLFISTISVIGDPSQTGANEESSLATVGDPNTEEVNAETYGGLKVLCEEEVTMAFGDKALNVRPGMIVGPYDKTDRFTYWYLRAYKGGKMLSLCERDEAVQFIDGRDLATFCFHLLANDASGAFMAVGPEYPATWGDVFDEAALLGNTTYEIVRPPLDVLESYGIERGPAFPSQVPAELEKPGFYTIDISKAIAAGIHFRPLRETIEDTIEWRNSVPDPLKVGLSAEKEAGVIEKYLGEEV